MGIAEERLPRWSTALLALLLAVAGGLAYANTLRVPFYFDDIQNLEENSAIHLTSLAPAALAKALGRSPCPTRPVANLSFALNYYAHGDWLPGFHLVNVAVHLLAAFFLFLLLKNTLVLPAVGRDEKDAILIAFAAALVWLLHPLQTQAVTYVVQRMASLAGMFYLLAFYCYLRGRRQGRRRWLAAAAAAGLLAMGSKETAVTLPFFLFLYEWYFLQDLDRRWLVRQLPVAGGVVGLLVVAALVYTGGHPWRTVTDSYRYLDYGMTERLLTESRVIFFYLSLLFYPDPSRLTLDHDFAVSHSLLQPPATLAAVGGLMLLVVTAVVVARRARLASFAIFWYLGNLFVESSFMGLELVFEHRLYLPSALPVAVAILGLFRLVRRRDVAVAMAVAIALLLGFWTHQRNETWREPLVFQRDLVRKAPAKARPHYNLGLMLLAAGHLNESISEFSVALAQEPRLLMARYQLAVALGRAGRLDEAIANCRAVLALVPDDFNATYTLGVLLRRQGAFAAARDQLRRALALSPENPAVLAALGMVFHQAGNLAAAEEFYRRTLAAQPDNVVILNNLGVLYRDQGDRGRAIQCFRRALAVAPGYDLARQNLRALGAAGVS